MNPDMNIISRLLGGDHVGKVLSVGAGLIQICYALVTLLAFVGLIVNITKFAQSAGNPAKRREAIHGMMVCGLCTAVLGGLGMVFIILVSFV